MIDPTKPSHTIDLWRLLPRHNRRSDTTGDLRHLIGCLQSVTDLVVHRIEAMHAEFDPLTASPPNVDLMLEDLGNPFGPMVPLQDARRLTLVLGDIYRQKGTAKGIANAIRMFVGLEVQDIYCSNTAGDKDGTAIGRVDRSSIYAFDVIFGHPLTNLQRQRVRALVEYMKPAHTHLGDILPLNTVTEGDSDHE